MRFLFRASFVHVRVRTRLLAAIPTNKSVASLKTDARDANEGGADRERSLPPRDGAGCAKRRRRRRRARKGVGDEVYVQLSWFEEPSKLASLR